MARCLVSSATLTVQLDASEKSENEKFTLTYAGTNIGVNNRNVRGGEKGGELVTVTNFQGVPKYAGEGSNALSFSIGNNVDDDACVNVLWASLDLGEQHGPQGTRGTHVAWRLPCVREGA